MLNNMLAIKSIMWNQSKGKEIAASLLEKFWNVFSEKCRKELQCDSDWDGMC